MDTVSANGANAPFYRGDSSGTHYKVMAGKPQIVLTPAISASITFPNLPVGNAVAGVSYSAAVAPVTLRLDITNTLPNVSDILIGQGCTAYIQAGALPSGSVTFSSFNWTLSGETFKSFVVGNTVAAPLSPSHPYGRVNYLAASDLTSPTPHWYWKKGGEFGAPATVSCTATASVNGVSIGSVTGSKTINVWTPYNKFQVSSLGVNLVTGPSSVIANISYNGAVGTPDLFRSKLGGAAGVWQLTQLTNYGYTLRDPLIYVFQTNGLILDAEFNFSSKEAPPAPWPATSTKQAPVFQSAGDAPTVALSNFQHAAINSDFDVYVMYYPPGNDVQWVPVNKAVWNWNSVVDLVNGTWLPTPPGTITISSNAASSEFPLWEDYFTDGSH